MIHLNYPFTAEDAIQALRDSVDAAPEGPNFVYTHATCTYVDLDGRTPSCLVGHALVRLGVPIDVLTELDAKDDSAADNLYDFGIGDERASLIFSAAQQLQDASHPWGDALAAAERHFAGNEEDE